MSVSVVGESGRFTVRAECPSSPRTSKLLEAELADRQAGFEADASTDTRRKARDDAGAPPIVEQVQPPVSTETSSEPTKNAITDDNHEGWITKAGDEDEDEDQDEIEDEAAAATSASKTTQRTPHGASPDTEAMRKLWGPENVPRDEDTNED